MSYQPEVMQKRAFVIRELYESEVNYCKDLGTIVHVFLEPMKKKKIVGPELIEGLFGNVPMLKCVNERLLNELKNATQAESPQPDFMDANVGAVIHKFAPFFGMYSDFCKRQKRASEALRELKKKSDRFNSFQTACRKNPDCRGLDLSGFLIMPVQRIPRYQLLLRELKKCTPEDHPDYIFIVRAMEKIIQVAKECDKSMLEEKDASLIVSLQNALGETLIKASRKLEKYGSMSLSHNRKESRCVMFLLSDLIIITNDFGSELTNLKIMHKFELFMFNYEHEPGSVTVIAQSYFERMTFSFRTEESAEEWHRVIKDKLDKLLQRHIGAKCEICHFPLKPALCCHCIKCQKICCHCCCKTFGEQLRDTVARTMICKSCCEYNEKILRENRILQRLLDSVNDSEQKEFYTPVFPTHILAAENETLPDGWSSCQLPDFTIYYYNRNVWLSSWCLPKDDFENDAPVGWQKYYDERGEAYYHNASENEYRIELPKQNINLEANVCSSCQYELPKAERSSIHACPSCNSKIQ